jgi:oligopeptidase A
MLDKMLQAKNFQSAMMMVRQLEFALFDFRLHAEFDETKENQVQEILDSVREQVTVVPVSPFNRFQHAFSHIFGGGYAAGYYSYKWAEVLSADAFAKFVEDGIFNRQTGEKFLSTVLEQGGSKDAMDLFVAFRGREPSVDALLTQEGII